MKFKKLVATLVYIALASIPNLSFSFDTGNFKLSQFFKTNSPQFLKDEEGVSPPALAFNSAGDILAARSGYQKITIWDWRKGLRLHSLEIPKGANDSATTTPIQFSPDGSKFIACYGPSSKKQVMSVWDTKNWALEHEIVDAQFGSGSTVCRFTPDGKYLVRALKRIQKIPGDTLIVYDAKTWQPIIGTRTNPLFISDLSISKDGKSIALLGSLAPTTDEERNYNNKEFANLGLLQSTHIVIVNIDNLNVKNNIEISQSSNLLTRIAWAPSGEIISYATGQDLVGINASDGVQIYHLASKWLSSNSSLAYSQETQDLIFAYASPEARVQVWNKNHNAVKLDLHIENNGVATISQDGKYIAASVKGGVNIWPVN